MIVRVKSPLQREGSTGEGKGDEGDTGIHVRVKVAKNKARRPEDRPTLRPPQPVPGAPALG